MPEVEIYTAGACDKNPGRGGWCAILSCQGKEKIVYGEDAISNYDRIDLLAAVHGLSELNSSCKVRLISNSHFLCEVYNQKMLENWKNNKWKKSNGMPVMYVEIWKQLLMLTILHDVTFEWGGDYKNAHAGVKRANEIAKAVAQGRLISKQ